MVLATILEEDDLLVAVPIHSSLTLAQLGSISVKANRSSSSKNRTHIEMPTSSSALNGLQKGSNHSPNIERVPESNNDGCRRPTAVMQAILARPISKSK